MLLLHFLNEPDTFYALKYMLKQSKRDPPDRIYFFVGMKDYTLFLLSFKSMFEKKFPRLIPRKKNFFFFHIYTP